MSRSGQLYSVNAEIIIPSDLRLAKIIEGSLRPEVEDPVSQRSTVSVQAENDQVKISVKATDLAALRAALNSYLRWVKAIQDVVVSVS